MRTTALFLLAFAGACASASAEPASAPAAPSAQAQERPASRDAQARTGMKPYAEVITADAVTDEGLFHVHTVGDDLFYEIPTAELGREMLLLTRVARTPDNAGYGGSKANTSVVRWERNRDRILLRLVSYENVADPDQPIATAVRNSNFEPCLLYTSPSPRD